MTVIGGSGSNYGHIDDAELARRVAEYRERNLDNASLVSAVIANDDHTFPADLMIAFLAEASARGYSRNHILGAIAFALYDNAPDTEVPA